VKLTRVGSGIIAGIGCLASQRWLTRNEAALAPCARDQTIVVKPVLVVGEQGYFHTMSPELTGNFRFFEQSVDMIEIQKAMF